MFTVYVMDFGESIHVGNGAIVHKTFVRSHSSF